MEAPLYLDVADAPMSGEAYWATTVDKKRIRFAVWDGDGRGTVLILPGRGEYIEKYGRVVGQITARGFACIVLDWRGQGLSEREGTLEDPGYVADYTDYQSDLSAVLKHEAAQRLPKTLHLMSHSMGGVIALRALKNGLAAKTAIFSAPMWGMGLSAPVRLILKAAASIAVRTGRGKERVWGTNKGPYILDANFSKNTLMGDRDAFEWFRNQLVKHPQLGLGGPSWMWLNQSHHETGDLRSFSLPRIPILTLLGEDEKVVNVDAIRERMARTETGKLVALPKGRHEVFMETPAIQAAVWTEIDRFLSLNSAV